MKSVLRQFAQRDAGPLVQFIKYGICGCVAVMVHITIFYCAAILLFPALTADDQVVDLLRRAGLSITSADNALRGRNAAIDNGISFVFSNLTAYILNIIWVFKPGRHNRVVEVAMFYAVSGFSMVIGTTIQTLLINRCDLTTTIAFGSNIVVATLVNFAMRKFVIFKG